MRVDALKKEVTLSESEYRELIDAQKNTNSMTKEEAAKYVKEWVKYVEDPDAIPVVDQPCTGEEIIEAMKICAEEVEKENEPKIKGWVARCKWPCPDELYFYRGEEKPIRCGSHVEDVKEDFYWDFQYEVAPLDPSLFPDLKWEDEPIEVELIIKRV